MVSKNRSTRIGVDVGGTNTDAVAVDLTLQHEPHRGVIACFKTATTPDATSGIETAVKNVIATSAIDLARIASVTIGTTHFINAVVERDSRRLRKVAVLRISKSFLREVPPFAEFPPDLKAILNGYVGFVDGGLHIDGSEEAPLIEAQIVQQCAKIRELGISAIVVAGVYSPIDEVFEQEYRVRDIVLRELPGVDVVCSRDVANIGFMERENASILNVAILKYARGTVARFQLAMKRLHLTCPLFLTQNDGTILDCASAARIPIKTFSSGATNSMRGAAYLSRVEDGNSSAIVIDIGGTTSDVGILLPSGLPRKTSAYPTVAGVRVNYSMPHLHSIGLGGGSLVRSEQGKVKIGPESVGNELTTRAMVFGGTTCTATDVVVAAGSADVGDGTRVAELPQALVEQSLLRMEKMLERAVDVIRISPDPMPVLLVGGGAILAPKTLKGATRLVRPPFYNVANAVGAAISRVSGTVDIVQGTITQTVQQAVDHAKELAISRARSAGALEESIRIAEIETIPLQYVANRIRTIVRAVGDVDFNSQTVHDTTVEEDTEEDDDDAEVSKDLTVKTVEIEPEVDHTDYRPQIEVNSKGVAEWVVSETDLGYLADGCYVLGCAGGGSPAASRLQLRDMLRAGHKIRIIEPSSLKEDDVIYWGGHMGSPATSVERLQATETVDAFKTLMAYLHHTTFDAVMGLEIGGANGLEPLLAGSSRFFDRPIIDADWMGRAYPTYWQTTLAAHAPGELVPCAIDSGDGKSLIMVRAPDDEIVDRALRASCAEMGSRVGMAAKPTSTHHVLHFGVLNTCSLAWRIGRAIARCKAANHVSQAASLIIEEAGGQRAAKILFRGKIVNVERRLFKGHSYGTVHIDAFDSADDDNENADEDTSLPALVTGGSLKIPFKNENIQAEHVDAHGTSRILASVPDLICILDNGSGLALGVPEFKYGYRVTVLGITCSPRWTDTPLGLKIGGPEAFGYQGGYVPLGKYVEPRSVIEEYR